MEHRTGGESRRGRVFSHLAVNTGQNLVGQAVPTVVALSAIPFILNHLGIDRFALLSIGWSSLSYISFLDLGVGRATTHMVARHLRLDQRSEAGRIILAGLAINLSVGIFLALLIQPAVALLQPLFGIGESLWGETEGMFRVLIAAIPILIVAATFRSALEGEKLFGFVNVVKAPFNALLFILPAFGAWYGWDLLWIMASIVASRLVMMLLYLLPIMKRYSLFTIHFPSRETFRSMLAYGGWITVSNVLTPLLMHGERVIIPALLSVGSLAFYTAPFEMVSRLAILPYSLALSAFPRISAVPAEDRFNVWERHVAEPLVVLLLLLTPIVGIVLSFSWEILSLWLGDEFASQGVDLLRLLAIAFFANGFAHVLLAAVQGLGRPDLKAKLDIIEVILLFTVGIAAISWFGLNGAGLVKVLLYGLDASVLFLIAKRLTRVSPNTSLKPGSFLMIFLSIIYLMASYSLVLLGSDVILKILISLLLTASYVIIFLMTQRRFVSIQWIVSLLPGKMIRSLIFRKRGDGA